MKWCAILRTDATQGTIWDIFAHGCSWVSPVGRRAHHTPPPCKPCGWPATPKRIQRPYLMISTASRVHMGPRGPTCHVRHTYLTPNVIRFLSVRTHARRFLDKTYRNVNMFVYRIICRPFGGSRAPCPTLCPLSTGRIPRVSRIGSRTPERDTRTGGWGIARASHFPLI